MQVTTMSEKVLKNVFNELNNINNRINTNQ
jgi:hypothetical protein